MLLGEVPLNAVPEATQLEALRLRLQEEGFEWIDDRKTRLIEEMKRAILHHLLQYPEDSKDNLSNYLSRPLHHEYSYLSHLFSSVEGMTIEQFFIA